MGEIETLSRCILLLQFLSNPTQPSSCPSLRVAGQYLFISRNPDHGLGPDDIQIGIVELLQCDGRITVAIQSITHHTGSMQLPRKLECVFVCDVISFSKMHAEFLFCFNFCYSGENLFG
jgi:hypothetical protein